MIEIQGTILEIIFHNKENGYSITVMETADGLMTAVGCLPSCGEGRTHLLYGDFKIHPSYGEQFAFKEAKEVMPATEDGIINFLSSGILKGIGQKAATAVVASFGEKTFEIIEKNPERLTEVNGIGEKKAQAIAVAFQEHRQLAEITMYLQQFDINPAYAIRLYKVYGEETIAIVEENPYRLATELAGVGFKKADRIAAKMGVDKADEGRIKSGILYTISLHIGDGHTYVPRGELLKRAGEILEIEEETIDDGIIALGFLGEIRIESLEGQEVVYLMDYYIAEQSITKKLAILRGEQLKPIEGELNSLINLTEREIGKTFSEEQKQAVATSLSSGVTVITGGPGTGKTTIINGILTILKHNSFVTAVAAPTGRAAKRITETTGHPASTIHRLLEYQFSEDADTMYFGRNEENPLDCEVLIVDEASMVDLMLMNGLVKALKPGTRLVLVGDRDQLPSVGAGNILSDILACEFIHSIRLIEIFRQAVESLIVVNAHRINHGEYPEVNEKGKDFFLIGRKTEQEMLATIVELCTKRLPNHYKHCDPRQDIQVLTPVRKGKLGSIVLNKELQATMNPPSSSKSEKEFGDKTFRVGDKVMQIKNNYSLKWKRQGDFVEGEGVFNGDLGYIYQIDKEFSLLTIVFDDNKYVDYGFGELDQIELAYAVTVHKSQGSEFPVVVMPISWFPPMLATRNLLYTAVTRGKEAVILVGSEGKMRAMIDNDRITQRYSGLRWRLNKILATQ